MMAAEGERFFGSSSCRRTKRKASSSVAATKILHIPKLSVYTFSCWGCRPRARTVPELYRYARVRIHTYHTLYEARRREPGGWEVCLTDRVLCVTGIQYYVQKWSTDAHISRLSGSRKEGNTSQDGHLVMPREQHQGLITFLSTRWHGMKYQHSEWTPKQVATKHIKTDHDLPFIDLRIATAEEKRTPNG